MERRGEVELEESGSLRTGKEGEGEGGREGGREQERERGMEGGRKGGRKGGDGCDKERRKKST